MVLSFFCLHYCLELIVQTASIFVYIASAKEKPVTCLCVRIQYLWGLNVLINKKNPTSYNFYAGVEVSICKVEWVGIVYRVYNNANSGIGIRVYKILHFRIRVIVDKNLWLTFDVVIVNEFLTLSFFVLNLQSIQLQFFKDL